jgi:hypothetical protein
MPAGNTYESIATNTVSGSSTATVTLSSIPSTYTDLVLVMNASSIGSGYYNTSVQINGDSGNNYSDTLLGNSGASAFSFRYSNYNLTFLDYAGSVTNNFSQNSIINFMNYSNTSVNKSYLIRTNSAGQELFAMAGLWRNTAAINSISINIYGTNFAAGTTISLYGIKAA